MKNERIQVYQTIYLNSVKLSLTICSSFTNAFVSELINLMSTPQHLCQIHDYEQLQTPSKTSRSNSQNPPTNNSFVKNYQTQPYDENLLIHEINTHNYQKMRRPKIRDHQNINKRKITRLFYGYKIQYIYQRQM